MKEFFDHLDAVERSVSAGNGSIGVLMRRRYDADITDVWDAVTDAERLRRWFLPISGDLRVGGTFQLEGNAGGEILVCEPPKLLRVTFGDATSIVEVRLTPDGAATTLELEHTVPEAVAGSGAGAMFVGPGWDGALLALALYHAGEIAADPVAAANTPEGQDYTKRSANLWAAAVTNSGTATPEQIAEALAVAEAHYAPNVE